MIMNRVSQLADEIKYADAYEALDKSELLAALVDHMRESAPSRNPAGFFLQRIPEIEDFVVNVGQQRGMSREEIDELMIEIKLRLMGDDYASIRAFKGRSSFATYMSGIIAHHLAFRSADDRAESGLAGIVQNPHGDADRVTDVTAHVTNIVSHFIRRLPEEDRLVFKLRFETDMTIATIARTLKVDAESLYRRLHQHFAELRQELEHAGIPSDDVKRFMGQLDFSRQTVEASSADPDGKN
jgi:RNA polymerase sigma factor (sigma-70 family)